MMGRTVSREDKVLVRLHCCLLKEKVGLETSLFIIAPSMSGSILEARTPLPIANSCLLYLHENS